MAEVSPLSGRVCPRRRGPIRPITGRPSLFPTPIPASPSVGLTAFLPVLRQERYGLTTFHKVDKDGLGALSPPVALNVHDRVLSRPYTRYSALLAQAWQHLWLVAHHDVYREFTCVAHTTYPSPYLPCAGRTIVPSRFRQRLFSRGYIVSRLFYCLGYC